MRRTLNFTDRKLIPQDNLDIDLQENGEVEFAFNSDLDALDIPSSAKVYVEAYYRTDRTRFDWGTVGSPSPPDDRTLTNFSDPRVARFRVKVVDVESDLGRILAHREQIRPRAEENEDDDSGGGVDRSREALLPVGFRDLDGEVWRLNLDPAPTLELNNRREEVESEFRHNPQFRALVLPAVFRQVLNRILVVDPLPLDEIRSSERWEAKWLAFAEKFSSDPPPEALGDEIEERRDWIDGVVAGFSSQHGFLSEFVGNA